jgi:hypothetical protein
MITDVFLYLLDSPESATGGSTRFFRRQPCGDGIALGKVQVGENLVLQLAVEVPFAH